MQRSAFKQHSHHPRVKSAVAISAFVGVASVAGLVVSPAAKAADGFTCNFDVGGMITTSPSTAGSPYGCKNTTTMSQLPSGSTYEMQVDDKLYKISDTPIAFTGMSATSAGTLAFHMPSASFYTAEVVFLGSTGAGLNGPSVGSFTYEITITDPTQYFDKAWLDSVVNVPGMPDPITMTKTIKFLDISAADWTVGTSSNGGSTGMLDFPQNSKHIQVTDSWNVPTSTAQLRSGVNTFTQDVPGPLPVLGAGAAFGFSRKLRSRVRLARGV